MKRLVLCALTCMQASSHAASITLVNNIPGLVKFDLFDRDDNRIAIAELYHQETRTITTSKTITKITWQQEIGLLIKSMRYTLEITIPWYLPHAGIFSVLPDGRYASLLYGKGSVEGEMIGYWES